MDFSWTDEQRQRRQSAVDFAEQHLNEDLVARDQKGTWSWELWRKCADHGILGLVVPEEYGGSATDIMTAILVMEGIGYGCGENSLPYALSSQMWSMQPALQKFGTHEQRSRYLTRLVVGDCVGAFAITEPGTGSDSYGLTTTAEPVRDGFVLNGTKAYITFAPIADFAIVFASTDPQRGAWGISAFVVDQGTVGFRAERVEEKMGLRSTPFGRLVFEDCLVPPESLLGPLGGGVSIFTNSMESERSYIFASQIGRMERQLEQCVDYARERHAFGKPIGDNQAVSNRIADMSVRLETARHLLYKVAWLDQQQRPLLKEAAMAKLHISECFVQSSLDAIRIHGARGYATEFEIERDLRDGVGGLLLSGTSDIQRNIVSRISGL